MSNRENLEASNLNSQNFDPTKYLHSFLKTNNTKNLIQKNIELEHDIKSYDQDIQSLVFENYNKFIISIETVKKMKENIIKVDDKLKVLSTSMQKINGLVSKIDDNLKIKRNEIQKLDTVNKDLQKLKKICEFPHILKNDIQEFKTINDLGNVNYETMFNNSIEYFKSCFSLLNKLKTEPLIKPIYYDSINNVEEMRSIIWNLQSNKAISMKEMRFIIKKLLVVIDDKELVLKNYLKFVKDKLNSNLKSILDSYSENKDDGMKQEEELTHHFLEERKFDVTLEELEAFKIKSEEDLAQQEILKEGTCLWLISRFSQSIFPEVSKEFIFLYQEVLPILNSSDDLEKGLLNNEEYLKEKEKHQSDFTDKIEQIVKDITMLILTSISEKLAFLRLSNMQVNDAFKKLNYELNNLLGKNISRNLRTEIIDKFSENVEHVFRSQLFDSFSHMRLKFIELLIDLKNSSKKLFADVKEENELDSFKKDIFSSLNVFKNKLFCIVATSLIEMKPFIQQQDNFLKSHLMFFSLLHSQFTEFIRLIVKIMVLKGNKFSVENITGINSSLSTKYSSSVNIEMTNEIYKLKEIHEDSSYYLVIKQFLMMFENKLLYKYFEILFDLYHKTPPSDLSLKQQYQSLRMNIENNEIPKLISSLKIELNKNLVNYSEFYYEELLGILKKYLHQNNWLYVKEAKEISPDIEKTVPVFKRILLELSILFPDLKRGIVKKNSVIKFKSPLDIDMERILAKKSHHFEKNDLNRNSLLLSILKSLLKGIIEHIRKNRLDRNGFQQLQVDMYFIVQLCYEMVAIDDESLIIGFYFEMIQNAGEMCAEVGGGLEQNIIESIANFSRNKLKI